MHVGAPKVEEKVWYSARHDQKYHDPFTDKGEQEDEQHDLRQGV